MRVFEYLIKTLDNQVIDQILKSSNTQNNLDHNKLILSTNIYTLIVPSIESSSVLPVIAPTAVFSIAMAAPCFVSQ